MSELQRNSGRETPLHGNEGMAEELTQYWMNMTEWDYSEKNKQERAYPSCLKNEAEDKKNWRNRINF